jgi:hypothetical protein
MENIFTRPTNNYFKLTVIFLLFLLLAFDRDLAMIYLLIMVGDFIWYISDNFISFPMTSTHPRFSGIQVLLESSAGLGLFLLLSTMLVSSFSPQSISGGIAGRAQSIFHLLATSTPILQGSKALTLIGWGILVPIIETSFFNGRLLEGLSAYAEDITGHKVSVYNFSAALIVVMFVVAALFTLFHITAKGVESIPLIITFIFSFISSILVVRHRELRGAILMHIATNSAAVASSFGWL